MRRNDIGDERVDRPMVALVADALFGARRPVGVVGGARQAGQRSARAPHDDGAGPEEFVGDSDADAATGAGDDGDLAVQHSGHRGSDPLTVTVTSAYCASVPAVSKDSLRDRQRARVRADIRRAAYRLFGTRGYHAVTTEEIAAGAGVSPRTFFRYFPTKEELLLGPVRHGGAEVVLLLESRPTREAPDTALAAAMITRTRSFDESDNVQWRKALLGAPELLDKVSMHTAEDKERATKLIADRMHADPIADVRPGLLVAIGFAAADHAFGLWVRQSTTRARSLDSYVTEAMEAIRGRHWRAR